VRIFLVGLGNPGKEYHRTRHNIGQIFVDYLCGILGTKYVPGKGEYVFAEKDNLFMFKNLTYMNLSGVALKNIVEDFDINVSEELFVCHDDLDMIPYSVKVKYGGGSGGHKGVDSCIFHLETEDFFRVKFGIGKPAEGDPRDYVLSEMSNHELILYEESFKIAYEGLIIMLREGIGKGVTFINTNGKRCSDE
jgi:PTH1 family peptidyl-tRNA hydrolase